MRDEEADRWKKIRKEIKCVICQGRHVGFMAAQISSTRLSDVDLVSSRTGISIYNRTSPKESFGVRTRMLIYSPSLCNMKIKDCRHVVVIAS